VGFTSCIRTLTESNFHAVFTFFQSFNISIFCFKIKKTCSCFSSSVRVSLDDMENVWWLILNILWTTTTSTNFTVITMTYYYDTGFICIVNKYKYNTNEICVRKGQWATLLMVSERTIAWWVNIRIIIFFLKQLYKNGKSSWAFASCMRIPDAWIEDNYCISEIVQIPIILNLDIITSHHYCLCTIVLKLAEKLPLPSITGC
jgi:hypothetical protein